MSHPLRLIVAMFLLLALGSAGRADPLVYDGWGPVIVNTEFTAAGRNLPLPTLNAPVTYRGASLGGNLGSLPGDDEPEAREINRLVTNVLAQQGFVPAQPADPNPALFISVQWGYLTPLTCKLDWFLAYQIDHDVAGYNMLLQNFRDPTIETILRDMRKPIYGVVVTAYDPATAHSPAPVVYWQTRIGIPANRKTLAQALPVMIRTAGPAIGRPADKPGMLDTDPFRAGTVTLGELKFLDTLDDAPPADPHNGLQRLRRTGAEPARPGGDDTRK